jgi:hypothetical protein
MTQSIQSLAQHLSRNAVRAATLASAVCLTGCGAMQVANNSNNVAAALAQGKAVLISEAGTFNPNMDILEHSQLPGAYRPPLTYWINRATKAVFILGAYDSEEGKGKVLTNEHFYYVLEPGLYDFAGYVQKTRFGSVANLTTTNKGIQSNIGFVNFSETTLPTFYTYESWVPPGYTGSTFDGQALTHWYGPGYWDTRGATRTSDAVFIDMRGLVPNAADGNANIGSFLVEAGQIAVAPDFELEFTHGACDVPTPGQWVCPLTSLTLSTAFSPQHKDAQETMANFRYSQSLIQKVGSTYLLPGLFFKDKKMVIAEGYQTTEGQPYGQFRVTQMTMPQVPVKTK